MPIDHRLRSKLGVDDGMLVVVLAAPVGFSDRLGLVPPVRTRLSGHPDAVVLFLRARAELERRIERVSAAVFPAGSLFLCWEKRSRGSSSDLTDQIVREVALPYGVVDTKVCSIDETWSSLKFVWRVERRGAPAPRRGRRPSAEGDSRRPPQV